MAAYFWVGGTGTWDNAVKTNWSLSSGGAGGAGPPTSADTVTFDSNSGLTTNQVVTIAGNAACGGCTISGVAGRAVKFSVNGNPIWGAGTYSFQGADDATPILFGTSTCGIPRTVTINGTHGTHSNVAFQDITLAGSIGTLTGTRIGDMHGNSGITFDAPSAQTWVGALTTATYLWSNVANWSGHIPLAQDDVTFSGSVASGQTVNISADTAVMGRDLDMSGITGLGTLNLNRPQVGGVNINNLVLGAFVLSSRVFNGGPSPANNIFLMGRGTHNLNFGNWGLSFSMKVQAVAGTYLLQANTLAVSGGFQIGSGTVDANGFSFNVRGNFQVSSDFAPLTSTFLGRAGNHSFGGNAVGTGFLLGSSAAPTLNFASGTGTWTLPGTGQVWALTAGATLSGFPTILITDASASSKTFAGTGSAAAGGGVYGIVRATPGTGGLIFTGPGNQFGELSVSGAGASLTVPAGKTQLVSGGVLTLRGQPGSPLTIVSGTPGTQATIQVADGTAYNIGDDTPSGDINIILPGGADAPAAHRVSGLNR